MVRLNLSDIQGNLLRGYNFPAAVYSFVVVPDGVRGRGLLRDMLPSITDARDWKSAPDVATNVAVTFAGLQALEVDAKVLSALPSAFRQPMAERAERFLGDTGDSAPANWDEHLGSGEAHILVMLAASAGNEGRPLAKALEHLDRNLQRAKATCIHRQEVKAQTQGFVQREHFGYADGYGQPAIQGVTRNLPGQGVPEAETGAWRDLKAGEFVLGYPDEEGETVSGPTTWLLRDGSYMVYRKLRQDVALFNREVNRQARIYSLVKGTGLTQRAAFELMAAKLVGRWRDGIAIALDGSVERGEKLRSRGHRRVDNDFRYGADDNGYVCPRGAHIRRANPRDLDDAMSRRHRIIRRGMPYGEPYADDDDERLGDRGLIFICFNADLERQFEVVQGQWCVDGNVFGLGGDQDFLLGNRAGKVTIEGTPPFLVPRQPKLVLTRGSEYLLMPGLAALERLAAPVPDRGDHERIPAGEAEASARVVELVTREMNSNYSTSRPVRRGQHPKSHGTVRAEFVVDETVPEDLRWGLFAEPGTYAAWVRFSGSHAPLQSDTRSDAHGMSIKVLGVSGEKILRSERWVATQDFVMVNHDVFFSTDAVDYASFAETITASGAVRGSTLPLPLRVLEFYAPPLTPWRWRLRDLQNLWATVGKRVTNPLEVRYWSQTPYALGPHAIKYSAKPVLTPGDRPAPQVPDGYESLLKVVAKSLKPADAEFTFVLQLQRQADPNRMPVENPTVRWSEDDSSFRTVATLRIRSQDVLGQSERNDGERLAFTPWHSRWEHRPLGGINRVRRAVYVASSELRRGLNDDRPREPGGHVPKRRRSPVAAFRPDET